MMPRYQCYVLANLGCPICTWVGTWQPSDYQCITDYIIIVENLKKYTISCGDDNCALVIQMWLMFFFVWMNLRRSGVLGNYNYTFDFIVLEFALQIWVWVSISLHLTSFFWNKSVSYFALVNIFFISLLLL